MNICITSDQLNSGLKILFKPRGFEIKEIGQRLIYEDMEFLLYHLFLIIDPKTSVKMFHSIYPARNQDDRSKFINQMVILINKHFPNEKVAASRLRSCGGPPFRALLASLMKKAASIESSLISRRLKRTIEITPSRHLLDVNMSSLAKTLDDLETANSLYRQAKKTQDETRNHKMILWDNLLAKLDAVAEPYSDSKLEAINKHVLDQMVLVIEECNVAIDKIESIQLSETPFEKSKDSEPKRLSYYVRELRAQIASTGDGPTTVEALNNQLLDYDDGMQRLVSILEKKKRDADLEYLKNDEMMERYMELQNLIPFVDIKPISCYANCPDPQVHELTRILDKIGVLDRPGVKGYLQRCTK